MCDGWRDDPSLSKDANAILKALACAETRRQLGHCLVKGQDGRWNIPVEELEFGRRVAARYGGTIGGGGTRRKRQ